MKVTAITGSPLPEVLPGFDHVSREWSQACGTYLVKILPGEYYVTRTDELITTVLGSCVAACVRDPETGIGGMNHFLLPTEPAQTVKQSDDFDGANTRYGRVAMKRLIDDVLRWSSKNARLEFKLFGGSTVLNMPQCDVGNQNILFVREYLADHGHQLIAKDLGGNSARKLNYQPRTGRAMVRKIQALPSNSAVDQEREYCDVIPRTYRKREHE